MRILIAPDSFKGTLTAAQAAEAIASAIRANRPEAQLDLCPMADGGEGTLDVILAATAGQRREAECRGPCFEPRVAPVGLIDHAATAVIELASAAGLTLVPPNRRNPLNTTTYGVGQLIAAALDAEVDRIILTLGGSATIDGGCGIAQALGCRMLTATGRELETPLAPEKLRDLRLLDVDAFAEKLESTPFTIAVDVLNPLLGPNGAAAVFGPQKGADAAAIETIERGLTRWADLLEGETGRDLRTQPGAGAAGGAALPILAFAESVIVPGADLVMQHVKLPERIAAADLVITGEGKLDRQSLMGKVVGAVARLAQSLDVPCIAVVGALGEGHEQSAHVLNGVIPLTKPNEPPEAAMQNPRERFSAISQAIARYF